MRDEFLSIASHELRTPLTSLKLRAERLHQQVTKPPATGQLDAARLARDAGVALTQVLHLVRMVDVLLDVSRISEGPLALDRDDLDVGPLVAGVADRLKEPATTAGSPIRVEIRGAATARWDRFRIEQVVTNLLSNAIKYGAGKPVDIVVAPSSGSARIVVTDRGPGIDAQAPRTPVRALRAVRARPALRRLRPGAMDRACDRRGARRDHRCRQPGGAGRVLLRRPAAHHCPSVGQLD